MNAAPLPSPDHSVAADAPAPTAVELKLRAREAQRRFSYIALSSGIWISPRQAAALAVGPVARSAERTAPVEPARVEPDA